MSTRPRQSWLDGCQRAAYAGDQTELGRTGELASSPRHREQSESSTPSGTLRARASNPVMGGRFGSSSGPASTHGTPDVDGGPSRTSQSRGVELGDPHLALPSAALLSPGPGLLARLTNLCDRQCSFMLVNPRRKAGKQRLIFWFNGGELARPLASSLGACHTTERLTERDLFTALNARAWMLVV